MDTIYFNNMSVQTGGGTSFSSENTVLVCLFVLYNIPNYIPYST